MARRLHTCTRAHVHTHTRWQVLETIDGKVDDLRTSIEASIDLCAKAHHVSSLQVR